MPTVERIVLSNFKKFKHLELAFDAELNVMIGDNEAGKSSVLLALELVLGASRSKVDTIGFEALIHRGAINAFLAGTKALDQLPEMSVEIYLSAGADHALNGKANSKGLERDGLRMTLAPLDDYSKEIAEAIEVDPSNFPFEFYGIHFSTFAGEAYSSLKRPVRHLALDSSKIDNEYAAREYTRAVFSLNADVRDRSKLENAYRQSKGTFRSAHLTGLNDQLQTYKFGVRTSAKSNLESDLVITEDDIPIESKGKGRQCFIKTEFALRKREKASRLDVLLLEEPENHLSHSTMKQLIELIRGSSNKQLFIATHSSLISARLDLRKTLLLGVSGKPAALKDLPPDTASFFMKAPDSNVLEFALSTKVILVEGDAEFILLDALYKKYSGSTLEHDKVHVISVGGTSFKRYLDLAKLIGVKTAVLRDNDTNYERNCVENYSGYVMPNTKVFADQNPTRSTFEICFYEDNRGTCDALFQTPGRKLSTIDYMIANKADAAFSLLKERGADLIAPSYIQEAIAWIRA